MAIETATNVAYSSTASNTTHSTSITPTAGTNKGILAFLFMENSSATMAGCTFGGQSMTLIANTSYETVKIGIYLASENSGYTIDLSSTDVIGTFDSAAFGRIVAWQCNGLGELNIPQADVGAPPGIFSVDVPHTPPSIIINAFIVSSPYTGTWQNGQTTIVSLNDAAFGTNIGYKLLSTGSLETQWVEMLYGNYAALLCIGISESQTQRHQSLIIGGGIL